MIEQVINGIICDLNEIEKHDVLYESIQSKLNKSLDSYISDIEDTTSDISDISKRLTDDRYFEVLRMIARRISI